MKNQLWARRLSSRCLDSRCFDSRCFDSRCFDSRCFSRRRGGLLFFTVAGRQQHGKRSSNH